ncbi:hypothetical protein DPMN_064713 [Dreissena polymorpha]|uniref:Uncharacterized protein n=1 Tax=Dreissena polymorpha TaxID=45954 RepID=A0A9D4CD90_DREPO|nr:hypothetical protein DPMN_064713 [Dreissena polymorpha]
MDSHATLIASSVVSMNQDVSTEIYHVTMEQRGITGKVVNMSRDVLTAIYHVTMEQMGIANRRRTFFWRAMQLVLTRKWVKAQK